MLMTWYFRVKEIMARLSCMLVNLNTDLVNKAFAGFPSHTISNNVPNTDFLLQIELASYELLCKMQTNVPLYTNMRKPRQFTHNYNHSKDECINEAVLSNDNNFLRTIESFGLDLSEWGVFNKRKILRPRNLVRGPLDCLRKIYGPVGLYWIVPIWVTKYITDYQQWSVVTKYVDCCTEPYNQTQSICPSLPLGCESEVRLVSKTDWGKYLLLHRYLMQYQCDEMIRCQPSKVAATTMNRNTNDGLLDYYRPEYAQNNDTRLFVAVAAGIPIGTGIVKTVLKDNSIWLSLELLCAPTRSRGGTLIVNHLPRGSGSSDTTASYRRI